MKSKREMIYNLVSYQRREIKYIIDGPDSTYVSKTRCVVLQKIRKIIAVRSLLYIYYCTCRTK